MNDFMRVALMEGLTSIPITSREGGPFGAVIVKNGLVIAKAHNEVRLRQDPTMHAEIVAIQKAVKYLQTIEVSRERFAFLRGCDIYCTCFPCPMCLGAVYWSNIENVYYGCSTIDAGQYNLNDDKIYKIVVEVAKASDIGALVGKKPERNGDNINFIQLDRDECLSLFEEWENREKVKKTIKNQK